MARSERTGQAPRRMSVAAALRAAAEVAGERTAVVQGDRRISHAELHGRASRIAAALADRGVGPGSTVAVALYNSAEYLETVLAAFQLGAAPVNINYRYQEPELRYVLEHTKAVALVHDAGLTDRVRHVAGSLPGLAAVLRVGSEVAGGEVSGDALSYDDVASSGPGLPGPVDDSGYVHGIILLTGGTTGRPKGVIWDRDGLLAILSSVFRQNDLPAPSTPAEVKESVEALAERDEVPVVLPLSPLMHGTGFFHAVRTLLGGGTVCFCTSRSLDVHEVWQAVRQHRVTEMVIVGDAFGRPLVAALAEAEQAGTPYDLSSLRRITSSGVAWSVDVKRALLAHGAITLVDNISASEGGPFGIAEARCEADLADGRFTLAPVARVLDEHDRDVVPGSGQVGVLASAGPQPVGYLGDPARTERTWRIIDGQRYAVPGDLASLDSDGKLVLLGRGDGVINTGGEKVFPEEVEQALLAHPAISDTVVFGMPDPRWGQVVTALVAPATELREIPDDELTAHLDAAIARYKRPRRLIRVDEIPRTPAGKVNRALARKMVPRTEDTHGMSEETFPIEYGHVLAFARALGAEPHPDGVPLTFPIAYAHFDPGWALRMRPGKPWNGSGSGPGGNGTGGGGGLHAEQEFEYVRPLQVGETLTVHKRPGRTWTKQGRSGVLDFTERHTEFYDPGGHLVARSTTVTVVNKPVPANGPAEETR